MPKVGTFRKIKDAAKRVIKTLFESFGLGITSHANLVDLQNRALDRSSQDLEFIRAFSPAHYEWMLPLLSKSRSQLRQDLFVLSECEKGKKGGVFC